MPEACLLPDACLKSCPFNEELPKQSMTSRRDHGNASFRSIKDGMTTSVVRRSRHAAVSNPQTTDTKEDVEIDDVQKEWWEKRTNDLVQLSTFPFLFLSIPQVLQNAVNLSNGNVLALSILSWKGFLTALAGNSILMTYFFKKGENGAAVVQAIGILSNFILLVQIYMAGLLQGGVLLSISLFLLVSSFVNGTVVLGLSRSKNGRCVDALHQLWEMCLRVLGLSLLVHVVLTTILPNTTLLPASITAVLSLTVDVLHWRDQLTLSMKKTWTGISAWTATFLFAFQPIGQLVCNFANPSSLAGLSLNTILLAMAGNGLMVPRALHTRDKIWLTGTLWSSLMMGWAQLLCLYVAGLQTGACYLSASLFYFLSSCAVLYFFFVFSMEAKSSKLKYPLESLLLTYISH